MSFSSPGMKTLRLVSFAFLLYLLLALVITWPLALNLGDTLPAGSDSIVHLWNAWWVDLALQTGRSPYQTDMLFGPHGISLVYHNFAWLHIVTWLLFNQILPAVAAYNLVLILHLSLCGVCAFLLIRHLVSRIDIALLAGLIYIAWPYRLTQPDHPNLHATWPVPLFFLTLIVLLERKRHSDVLLCGLAFGLVGYMRWQLLIPTTLMGLAYVLAHWAPKLAQREWKRLWEEILFLVPAAGVALLVLAPPIGLLASEWQQNRAALVPIGEATGMQTDLLAYVTPPPWHSVWGEVTTPLYETYYPARGSRFVYSPYIGLVPLILLFLGLFSPKKDRWGWLAISSMLILFALGPILRVNGQLLPDLPTLYPLFDRLYILRLLREPDRFNMVLALPVTVLAGYGMLSLSERWPRLPQNLIVSAAALLIFFEYSVVPLPLQTLEGSSFYATLAGEPATDKGAAIIDIPLDPFKSKPYMLAQITHGRPIVQGHASRYPDSAFDFLESDPWLNESLIFDGQPPQRLVLGGDFERLRQAGFKQVVIHKEGIESNYLMQWRRHFPTEPHFEDDQILVYSLDFESWLFNDGQLGSAAGLAPLKIIQSADCFNPEGVMGVDVVWWIDGPSNQLAALQAEIVLTNGEAEWRSEPELFTQADLSVTSIPLLLEGRYEWDLPLELPVGQYAAFLNIRIDGEVVEQFPLDAITIQPEGCRYLVPDPLVEINARMGDVARLIGYQVNQSEHRLGLDLLWRSEQRTGVNLTLFVHLFDLETNEIVSQHDGLTRQGTYPTSRWVLDEGIGEEIELDLADVPAGRYGLALGLYDAGTGQREPIVVFSSEGKTILDDGRLVVDEEIEIP